MVKRDSSHVVRCVPIALPLTASALPPPRPRPIQARTPSAWLVKLPSGKTVISGPDLEVV